MVLEDPARLAGAQQVEGIEVRAMSPEEAPWHVSIVAGAFELPEAVVAQVMTPEWLSLDAVSCYLGEVEGEPVATGLSIGLGTSAGIFDIANAVRSARARLRHSADSADSRRRHRGGCRVDVAAVEYCRLPGLRKPWLSHPRALGLLGQALLSKPGGGRPLTVFARCTNITSGDKAS